MERTNAMHGQDCNGDCGRCGCANCGEPLTRLIMGKTKKQHNRHTRRIGKDLLKNVCSVYNWRLVA
jgi:hypothetical protein